MYINENGSYNLIPNEEILTIHVPEPNKHSEVLQAAEETITPRLVIITEAENEEGELDGTESTDEQK